jgi:hypothetical protein
MKIFISWSGDRSKKVAELLDDWIQCVIQAVDPWMSSKDIDRGALWFTEITDQLANTSIGIVCLTKENKNKSWILFEAGALAKGLTSNRVCTFLIDLLSTDLENPLAQFNHTFPTRESVWELVRTINLTLKEDALKESILLKVFETYWPQFESDFKEVIETTPAAEVVEKRDENDIMLDVLSTVRMLDRRIRNIESNSENYLIKNERELLRKERIDANTARFTIKSMIEQDVPEDIIINTLRDKGVPSSFVKDHIRAFKSLDEELDNKTNI